MTAPSLDPRFVKKFHEQRGFLERSSRCFDGGFEEESLRIATSLRVLLHDTAKSISLFKHLGLKGSQLLSSSRGHGDWKDYLAQEIKLNSAQPVRMKPLLGDKFIPKSFDDWWEMESVFVHESRPFTRKRICLSAANRDGGAHVDEELEEFYEVLAAGQYMIGITGNLQFSNQRPPFPQGVTMFPQNAHFALIRQFAHEFLCSAAHYKWVD